MNMDTTRMEDARETMSKEEFIALHVAVCQAGRARKYDAKKSGIASHSLAYSRRKCAKKLWKDFTERHYQ